MQDDVLSKVYESGLRPRLDLGYFVEPTRCSLMVQRGARRAFELFLYLAYQSLRNNGEPVLVDYQTTCQACGLDPAGSHCRSAISRLLRSLRGTFRVIDYQPLQRRRPQLRLAPATPDADVTNPRHYVDFAEGWDQQQRAVFDALGPRAFSAEYMYWIAKYESKMASTKHQRDYWFFPLDRISAMYHVSPQFAGAGLRGLVELGIMRVMHGQWARQALNDEFGRANRYYFKGLSELWRRQREFARLESEYGKVFDVAKTLATSLTNGQTVKNVHGICELITTHGETKVRRAIKQIAALPTRSLKRRLAYVSAVVAKACRKARR